MLKSALLFYRNLISELKEKGFEVNPYDPCAVIKMVNGSQMMIQWHVDDLMIIIPAAMQSYNSSAPYKTFTETTLQRVQVKYMTILE
jgi:hypothetical protein